MAALTPDALDSLTSGAASALGRVAERPWSRDVYLAGSAALALYCGRRRVADLDLMGATNRLASADRRVLLGDRVQMDPRCQVQTARDGYMFIRLADGTALRFFSYPYPQIAPEQSVAGFAVVSALDLALMKLGAIISRGTRRDFVDLWLLTRRLPLAEILDRSGEKFGHVRDFQLQALKGLADRSLVEGEPMPALEPELAWSEVEAWLET